MSREQLVISLAPGPAPAPSPEQTGGKGWVLKAGYQYLLALPGAGATPPMPFQRKPLIKEISPLDIQHPSG
jgi:hypothetical protein